MPRCSMISLACAGLLVACVTAAWALPPNGFVNEGILAGLDQPTDLAFLPAGRLLVTTKPGRILILHPTGRPVSEQTYMTVRNVHSAYAETGIMSVVLAPGFAANGYFSLYSANAGTGRYRVSRFHHVVDHGDAASELVVWDDDAP